MQLLLNKTVVITGAGQGIGRAVACYLAKHGANIVVNDLDASLLTPLVADIELAGGNATALAGSVCDWGVAEQLVKAALNNYGRLDALINNAGLHYVCEPQNESPERINQLVDVNVIGAMYCGVQALKIFKEQGFGSLINVSSGAHLGVENQAIYSASKGAIASLTYSWAIDAMPFGVRVNAVAPLALTRMIDALPEFQANNESGKPLLEEAALIAPVFGFLVADESAEISGQILRFNGRELSLIDHPTVGAITDTVEGWDLSTTAQLFQRQLSQYLSPLGLMANKYIWRTAADE